MTQPDYYSRFRKRPFGKFIGRGLLLLKGLVFFSLLLLAGLWWRTAPVNFDMEGAGQIRLSPPRQVIPEAASSELSRKALGRSNNNVDIVRFEGRSYMAFRTAPTHFASSKTRLVICTAEETEEWRQEHAIQLDEGDLREPRFMVYKNKLLLYFFKAGSNPFGFDPQHIYVTERGAEGQWSAPQKIYKPGYVVWRTRVYADVAYMSVYDGAGIYTTEARPGEVRLLQSSDGYRWSPISEQAQVTAIGAEEGEFIFDAAGNLYATVRLETQGALICYARKGNLAEWETVYTENKYDSALMFAHGADIYVIARRNVDGVFHKGYSWLPDSWERGIYLVRYSLTRKRTALYHFAPGAQDLTPLFDFNTRGDTAYAGILELDPDRFYMVNYSNDPGAMDCPWILGQLLRTNLYATEIVFEREAAPVATEEPAPAADSLG